MNAKDREEHTLAFFRHIENINVALLRHSMKFIDIASKQIDEEAQRMLSDLRDVRVSGINPSKTPHRRIRSRFPQHYQNRVLFGIQLSGRMKMV